MCDGFNFVFLLEITISDSDKFCDKFWFEKFVGGGQRVTSFTSDVHDIIVEFTKTFSDGGIEFIFDAIICFGLHFICDCGPLVTLIKE